jgi:hypothetical protein
MGHSAVPAVADFPLTVGNSIRVAFRQVCQRGRSQIGRATAERTSRKPCAPIDEPRKANSHILRGLANQVNLLRTPPERLTRKMKTAFSRVTMAVPDPSKLIRKFVNSLGNLTRTITSRFL